MQAYPAVAIAFIGMALKNAYDQIRYSALSHAYTIVLSCPFHLP